MKKIFSGHRFAVTARQNRFFIAAAAIGDWATSLFLCDKSERISVIKRVLAHSAIFHIFFHKIAFDWWYSRNNLRFHRSGENGAEASCHALDLLSRALATAQISGAVVFQYSRQSLLKHRRAGDVDIAIACALSHHFRIIDFFDMLSSSPNLDEFFARVGAKFGHMSAAGNGEIAQKIYTALKKGNLY